VLRRRELRKADVARLTFAWRKALWARPAGASSERIGSVIDRKRSVATLEARIFTG
jgi:hypothetical protein